jgi:hypothetical protein
MAHTTAQATHAHIRERAHRGMRPSLTPIAISLLGSRAGRGERQQQQQQQQARAAPRHHQPAWLEQTRAVERGSWTAIFRVRTFVIFSFCAGCAMDQPSNVDVLLPVLLFGRLFYLSAFSTSTISTVAACREMICLEGSYSCLNRSSDQPHHRQAIATHGWTSWNSFPFPNRNSSTITHTHTEPTCPRHHHHHRLWAATPSGMQRSARWLSLCYLLVCRFVRLDAFYFIF